MPEPAFYRCGACLHTWQRTEWRIRKNPPAVCPRCKSAEQCLDQEREDAYVRDTYGPITSIIGNTINKKSKARANERRKALPRSKGVAPHEGTPRIIGCMSPTRLFVQPQAPS